jgi:hypothetical protein
MLIKPGIYNSFAKLPNTKITEKRFSSCLHAITWTKRQGEANMRTRATFLSERSKNLTLRRFFLYIPYTEHETDKKQSDTN